MRAVPAVIVVGTLWLAFAAGPKPDVNWPTNGGPGNGRYSPLDAITRVNVRRLQVAWTYWWTGELPHHDPGHVEGVIESPAVAKEMAR